MGEVRFVVDETFDISSRAGLLVVGRPDGVIGRGTQLTDAKGVTVTVLEIELMGTRSTREAGVVSLMVPRDTGLDLSHGSTLIAETDQPAS